MKSSKEMADAVFRIRDAYAEKKNKRKIIIKRTALVGATACMFGLIFAALKLTTPEKPHPVDSGIIVETETAPSESDDTPTMPSTIAQSAPSTTSVQTATTQTVTSEADETSTSARSTTSSGSPTTAAAHTTTTAETTQTHDDIRDETELKTVTTTTAATVSPFPEIAETTQPVMTQVVVTVGTSQAVTTTSPTLAERLEVYQRFSYLEYNKKTYTTKGWEARSMEVGELIDSTVFVSDDSLISCNVQIYEFVSGIEAGAYPIVLKFEGYDGYWIYWQTM
ncbi:hypothetical protein SAMN02910353_01186 [Ruminococcus sp. YRD2003]|uniref:hypothetical protein n=1 Tax=Ruminococcus sp. YRD2003 TaxID=1452313 RepID=UPI0008C30837|nr:hypothetical protein SAMN02910353_01186 [Ruminococcus flavefaciens]